MTVRPLRAHDARRRPIPEHDVCRDGEHKMEQALAAAAAWPYADEPPPTMAEAIVSGSASRHADHYSQW